MQVRRCWYKELEKRPGIRRDGLSGRRKGELMTEAASVPIVKPTEIEQRIWRCLRPVKTGGVVRQGSLKPLSIPDYPPHQPDKNNPEDWDDKMTGGPRAEWWVYMMEGAHRILDVGCGGGFPSFYLASCGFDMVGVDPSPSEIARAEWYRQWSGASYQLEHLVIDEVSLPFGDNTFDGATFSSSLECLGDPEAMMMEVIRVLKPGSPVAIDDEDRRFEPKTHPVWEDQAISVVDNAVYFYYETRVCDPYLDRRYMIRLAEDGQMARRFLGEGATSYPLSDTGRGIGLDETGLSVEEVLKEAVEGRYGEARGYDA
jgi:ubiquinone/menaquinone biosynthesis C-methylase UbiE